MAVRIIKYQAMDGKWYDLEIADLIDPLDNCDELQAEIDKLKKRIKEDWEGDIDNG